MESYDSYGAILTGQQFSRLATFDDKLRALTQIALADAITLITSLTTAIRVDLMTGLKTNGGGAAPALYAALIAAQPSWAV